MAVNGYSPPPQRVRCGADAKMVWLTRIDYYYYYYHGCEE
jgi:hypothetical protein